MYTIEEIKNNYSHYSDAKIQEIAENCTGLRKEVVSILNAEIKRRKLDLELIKWVNYETNIFEGAEREKIIEQIENSVCSECFTENSLKGYKFNTLISNIFFLNDKTEYRIVCDSCGYKKRLNTIGITFLLGWWSRRGFFVTPFTILSDLYKIVKRNSYSKEIINAFIDKNTASLRLVQEGKIELYKLLEDFNDKEEQLEL